MGVIVGLVFVGVFALIALPLIAAANAPSRSARQAIETLNTAIKAERFEPAGHVGSLRKSETVSSIPWLNRKLLTLKVAPYLSRLLAQAAMDWTPGRLLSVCAFCFAVPSYVLYSRFHSMPLALLAGAVLGLSPIGFVMFKRSRRFAKFEEGLPEALDMMVSALRAGHSLVAAMSLVGKESPQPIGGEFRICFEEQNYGLELKEALDNMISRMPLQDLKIVATAIMIQKESGGNLAEVLDKTSQVVRERFRLKRQINVHTAQGRFTGLILTCIPPVLGLGMYLVNPKMVSILWERPIGVELLWAAAGMNIFGGFVIHRIVSIDV